MILKVAVNRILREVNDTRFFPAPPNYCHGVDLDDGIVKALWLSQEDASKMQLHSPLVMHDTENYPKHTRYPLNIRSN